MILDRYLVRQFFPIFAVAVSMFMLLLSLIDLFANLVRYLNYEVPIKDILTVSLYYLPKSFSYAMPLSLLFAAAYTLGDLYARNELTSIFSSGIPFYRFSLPLLLIGFAASFFSFYFDDLVVIPTLAIKNDLSRLYLHQQRTEENSNIVIMARNGELIYSVDFFDEVAGTLNGIFIIERNSTGEFVSLVRASQASWTGKFWRLSNPVIYERVNGLVKTRPFKETAVYQEPPDTFKRNAVDVKELHARDVRLLVVDLGRAGLPVIIAKAEYYHRFSFASASFVVMMLSISMGGRFRKNILLMSLFASLAAAVIFYVMEMITMMMARLGYIHPVIGAWLPVASFIIIGTVLLQNSKT
ncbi:membrane protein [Spirochaetia bacterium]|nr:membrane protein [Spirochaetia bacterium]